MITRWRRWITRGASVVLALSALPTGAPGQNLPLGWREVAPGVWRADAGTPEAVSLLASAGIRPQRDALARLGSPPLSIPREGIRATRQDGKIALRFPLGAREQLYGLGLNF